MTTKRQLKPERIVREPGYAERLAQAVEAHPHSPTISHGRQVWLLRELESRGINASKESVRKWFAGIMKPRQRTSKVIAQILNVDVAWLTLGVAPEIAPKERRLRDATADGAVNLVAGLVQMNGGHPAFPSEDNDAADLYAIIKGAQYAFRVFLAMPQSDGSLRFSVPIKEDGVLSIGVVPVSDTYCRFIELSEELVERHGVSKGPFFEVSVQQDAKGFSSNDERWPEITSFRERL